MEQPDPIFHEIRFECQETNVSNAALHELSHRIVSPCEQQQHEPSVFVTAAPAYIAPTDGHVQVPHANAQVPVMLYVPISSMRSYHARNFLHATNNNHVSPVPPTQQLNSVTT